jgi:hypothetical protein
MKPQLAPISPIHPPPPLQPRISLTGGARTVTINNGHSVAVTFDVTRLDTEAPISLAAVRLPPGVTAALSPPSLPASAMEQRFTLTLTAAPTALAAVAVVEVVASATDVISGYAYITVTIASPYSFTPGAPILPIGSAGESTTSSQTAVVLAAFGQAEVPFNLRLLEGATGTITFAAAGEPAGVTARFTPVTLAAPPMPGYVSITLTLLAGATVSPDICTISVTVTVNSAARGVLTVPLRLVAPFVSSVAPAVGTVPTFLQPGTPVTITGGGFGPGTTVSFGADRPVAAASIAANGTSLVVNVPATAASGPLAIVSPAGTASGTPEFAVDNYRNTRGFSWQNSCDFQTLAGSSYSQSDATALFGASQTIVNLGLFKFFNPVVDLFLALADAMLDSAGQCYGMSLGSLRFAAGQMGFAGLPQQSADAEPNGPPGPDAWLLAGPQLGTSSTDESPSLTSFVHQQHLAQLSQESINNWIGFHANVSSAAGLRSALQQAFTAGSASGMGAIVCLNPSTSEGHAVVAYEIADTGDGDFDILLYNPNVPFDMGLAGLAVPPGDTENEDLDASYRATQAGQSVIHVMSDGSWSATLNASGPATWTGGIFNITVVPWNAIPVTPTVPWVELATGAGLMAAVLWIVVGDASVTQVTDGQGHLLLADGQWNTNPQTSLPGVRPLPAFGGLGMSLPPAFASISTAPLTHTVTGNTSGSYDLRWIGNGYAVTMTGIATEAGSADTVQMLDGGVSFTTAQDKTITVAITGTGTTSGLPRTATLQTAVTAGATAGLSFDPANETFSYVNAGRAASYTLELSTVDSTGQPLQLSAPAPSAGPGDTLTFKPNWTSLTAGTGTVSIHTATGEVTNQTL